jgi:NAD(P)-dependent dehydrogenase (short-subunit alcohol dehydrogenase family)
VDERGLAATAAGLGSGGSRAESAWLDVARREDVERSLNALFAPSDRLDLLISCAAILGPGTWATQPADDFERVLAIDFIGSVNVVRAALPFLRNARGRIVLLASTAALHGWPCLGAYSAAKFAITGWAEAIRGELAREGVGMTTVFPLLIDTPLLSRPDTPPILRRGRRIPPESVVRKVMTAVAKGRPRVYIPGSVRLVAVIQGLAPSLLDFWGRRFGLE